MSKPLSAALYGGGMLIVLAMVPIGAVTAFQLIHMILFSGTLDGRIFGFILLLGLLPTGIGIVLFGFFLYYQIRWSPHRWPCR